MTDDITPVPEDDAVLAAEYVLHLLDPAAMAEAEARFRSDPAFAAQVRRWQEDFAALALDLDEVPPSPAARQALMARVFDEAKTTGAQPPGFFQRWRWGWATGLAAALVVAALLFFPAPDPAPTHVAELEPAAREFVLIAALTMGDTPQLELTRLDGPVAPTGRATELWAIPPDGAPISLGVLPAEEIWTVILPPDLAGIATVVTLALSDEPEGGSPTGAPTGEILAAAPLSEL